MFVSYESLLQDVSQVLRRLLARLDYDRFLCEGDQAAGEQRLELFWKALEAERIKASAYRSAHKHTLEDCCPDVRQEEVPIRNLLMSDF